MKHRRDTFEMLQLALAKIAKLTREARHWKANHKDVAAKARRYGEVIGEFNDRIAAIYHQHHQVIETLRAELEMARKPHDPDRKDKEIARLTKQVENLKVSLRVKREVKK